MDIKQIFEQLSVLVQFLLLELFDVVVVGFKFIICNCFDGEVDD